MKLFTTGMESVLPYKKESACKTIGRPYSELHFGLNIIDSRSTLYIDCTFIKIT